MSLYIGSIVINVTDIERATQFWTAALGYIVREGDSSFVVLTDPKRRWANISLQSWDEPKTIRNRLHLDLYSNDQPGEVKRLQSIGASLPPWEYPNDADYVVMADPEGNEFCIIQSSFEQS